jgi:signal transduction histidine kinase
LSPDSQRDERWRAWLLARNRRGTTTLLWIVITLYPLFGILDYLVAPREALGVLYTTRIAVTLVTLAMFRVVRSPLFDRHADLLSSGYMILNSCGIGLMTVHLGGLASPYYAGLCLAIVATGLLFVWPKRIVAATHTGIIAAFLVPNLLFNRHVTGFAAVSNLFFLVSTGIISGTGQLLTYRTQREQVAARLVIESTTANLEQAHAQLQRLDRFKSEFFANITHELKTPLTMILAPLELMIQGEMGKLTEPQRASLQSMLRSGVKLLRLIGDLLDLSKLNESRLRLQIAEHDLVSYLRSLTSQVQALTQRKSIDLVFESNVEQCLAFCDLDRLERVFINLLSNAAKFTPAQGKVRMSLRDEGERVRVSVIDNGIGFPPEMAEAIFERFFQVDMAGTRKFGGTGIGLSLARELVHLHGGKITAENGPSGGATFIVELLKDREHFEPERIDRRARQEDRLAGKREADHGVGDWQVEAQGQFRLIDIDEATDQRVIDRDPDEQDRSESVLVVEDTPDVIRVIHLALRSHFRVLAAPGGLKGFELATKHLPSLVITDLMMPDIDGMELTRMLRADVRTRHIPIVMLTARGDVEDRVAGLESGVNAYLTKPFSTKELVSTVRGLVRIQETTADLVLTHSMDSLETIAGGLAHEINNPLNYIKNAFSLIQSDAQTLLERVGGEAGGAEGSDLSIVVKDMTTRMDRMFGVAETGLRRIGATVMLMQRYSREGYTRVLQPLDVFEAARDVVAMLQTGVTSPVVETSFEGDGQLQCVPEEFNQVLTNLIQNALDAVPRDGTGRVRVTGSNVDGALVISVNDNGSGIRPEERAKIFTAFYTTKEVGKGMGLGLTIVRRVVTSLGGTVDVSSPASGGTEFTLRIPRGGHESSRGTASGPGPEGTSAPASHQGSGSGRG